MKVGRREAGTGETLLRVTNVLTRGTQRHTYSTTRAPRADCHGPRYAAMLPHIRAKAPALARSEALGSSSFVTSPRTSLDIRRGDVSPGDDGPDLATSMDYALAITT